MLTEWFYFIFLGLMTGLMSGLLGLGGGIVIVPGMYEWFAYKGIDPEFAMQISTGTALGTMTISTLSSAFMHKKMGSVHWEVVKYLMPGSVVGAAMGVHFADMLSSATLKQIFSCLLFIVAISLFFSNPKEREVALMKPWAMVVSGLVIGSVAGLMGVGGGIVLIPLLIYNGLSIRQSAATSLWCVFPTVTFGAIVAVLSGLDEVGLPEFSLGFLYMPALITIGVFSLITIPVGGYLSKKIPRHVLQGLFAVVLSAIAIKMYVS